MTDKISWNDLVLEKSAFGFGSFGDVYRATWKTKKGQKQIVVKKFRGNFEENDIYNEVNNLSSVKHENIVTLYGTTEDSDERPVMIMEYADCGSLNDILHNRVVDQQQISVGHRINWMLQCAKGIEYLHEQCPKILHRDLKPQNLLLFNNFITLKICDFGTVKQLATKMTYSVGTAPYMAPEVNNIDSYTEKCDVYSFGITFWEVMSGKKPFYHLGKAVELHIRKKAVEGDRPPVSDIQSFKDSDQVVQLIQHCWKEDPMERPNMCQVIKILVTIYENSEQKIKPIIRELSQKRLQLSKYKILKTVSSVEWKDLVLEMRVLGFGAFGDVYIAKWKSVNGDKTIVAKIFRNEQNIGRELKHLSRLQHENIMTFYGITEDDSHRTVLLEEYADCGSLYNVLHGNVNGSQMNYSYFHALKWMHQCVKGMAYMHEKNLIHRDLKSTNLLLINQFQTLKISNSSIMGEVNSAMTNAVGTVAYMAPEVFSGKSYTEKCDVYSFGILLWEVMSRKKPFNNKMHLKVIYEVNKGERPDLNEATIFMVCDAVKELITKSWSSDPKERPSMEELKLSLGNIILSL